MSFFSTPSQPANQAIKYTGLQVQTAVNTLPVPVLMGMAKLAPNIIDYQDFTDKPQSQGGKGGPSISTDSYFATLLMALCEGPITGINTIWKGSTVTTLAKLGMTLFTGGTPQTAWSYMTSAHPTRALGYNGTAYVAVLNYALGSSPNVDNHNFEIRGLHYGTGANGQDADPAQCIMELLTNPQWGAGFPASSIDMTSLGLGSYIAGGSGSAVNYGRAAASLGAYCQALGICFSPNLSSVETASSILQRWCKLTNCAAVWSGASLKFIPFGDATVAGNGVTFTPNVSPVYDLSDDDFIGDGSADPVEVTRSDVVDAKNVVRVEISDRANAYNLTPVESRDETMVNLYGLRIDSAVTAHEICSTTVAATVGQLVLQRGLYIRNSYQFKLSWEYCLLEPMDIVTLTDAGLGLAKTPVRITAIEEDDQGLLTVTAEEFPSGVATATQYPKQGRSPAAINYDAAASPVFPPVIFEPQSSLTGGAAQVWIGVSGGTGNLADPLWGGCNVWLSPDGISYAQIGTITAPSRQGVLTAAIAAYAGANPDNTNTLALDLSMRGAQLLNATAADAAAGRTLFYADGEIMAYATAALTSANHYNLSGLQRGLYGTAKTAHAAGTQFLRLDNFVFKYALPGQYVGKPMYFKFQSFNIWGAGVQDISTCINYTYYFTGAGYLTPAAAGALTVAATIPAAPTGLIATGGQNVIVLNWAANAEADISGYLVWSAQGANASFAQAAIVATVSATTWTHANLGYGETRSYWIEAVSAAGPSSPAGPAVATTAYTLPIAAIGANAISANQLIPVLQQAIASLDTLAQNAVVTASEIGQGAINTASLISTVKTASDGNTAAISTALTSINGLSARYAVQIQIDAAGQQYVGGFGLAGGPDGAGGISFDATFLVDTFTIAQMRADGTIAPQAPFYVSNGSVYIQDAMIGTVSANKITSGTITTQKITVQPPAGSGGGLTIMNEAGMKVLDSALGLWPGAATSQTQSTQYTGWPGNQVLGATWVSAGHGALCFVNVNTSGGSWAPGNLNVNLTIYVDGVLTYTYLNIRGGDNTNQNLGAVSFALPVLGAGSHTIQINATTANGGPPTMNAGSSITVIDFKA